MNPAAGFLGPSLFFFFFYAKYIILFQVLDASLKCTLLAKAFSKNTMEILLWGLAAILYLPPLFKQSFGGSFMDVKYFE